MVTFRQKRHYLAGYPVKKRDNRKKTPDTRLKEPDIRYPVKFEKALSGPTLPTVYYELKLFRLLLPEWQSTYPRSSNTFFAGKTVLLLPLTKGIRKKIKILFLVARTLKTYPSPPSPLVRPRSGPYPALQALTRHPALPGCRHPPAPGT